MKISKDVYAVGVIDKEIDLFEGQYAVPDGMRYTSDVILDEKVAIFDTVDRRFAKEWLENIQRVLGGRVPDYLIVQHMEPDHSAAIAELEARYPDVTVVGSARAFPIMEGFFGKEVAKKRLVVGEGDELLLGRHHLSFIAAPMVHWPEVILTWDGTEKTLFCADAFGKFGASGSAQDWVDEARRYYIGIVGKYGAQVQALLKKAAALDIARLCPLHGPVLDKDLGYYVDLYDTWSSYRAESEGVLIAYTSVYGNTAKAVEELAERLREAGCPEVCVRDLARCDMHAAVADAFRLSKVVLATTTYNGSIFPHMHAFLNALAERNFCKRTVALIENGSWAPMAARIMRGMLEKCKEITFVETEVRILCAPDVMVSEQLAALTAELCADWKLKIQAKENTVMEKYVCEVCGWTYDEATGDAENGIAPGTRFEDLPEDFVCPLCGVGKDQFVKE